MSSEELDDLYVAHIVADLEIYQLVGSLLVEACDLFQVPDEVRRHVMLHYPRSTHTAGESAAVQLLEWLETEHLDLIQYGAIAAGMWGRDR